eukprot:2302080-Prymnesium_polylepis.1
MRRNISSPMHSLWYGTTTPSFFTSAPPFAPVQKPASRAPSVQGKCARKASGHCVLASAKPVVALAWSQLSCCVSPNCANC